MALEIPSQEEIEEKIFLDVVTNLNQDQSACSVSLINAFSKAIGFQVWSAYICQQTLGYTPLDATGSRLAAFGLLCGIERFQPQFSFGFVTAFGTGTIPIGTTLTRCDGVRYQVLEEIDAPSSAVPIISLDEGQSGNAQRGVTLTFDSAIINVDPTAYVSENGLAGGSDLETEDNFRQRVIACTANPCRTGTIQDYEFWAFGYNGVTCIQVLPCYYGPGTVKLCFAMQNTYQNGIPLDQDIINLQEIIDNSQPLGIKTTVCAAEPVTVDIQIRLLDGRTLSERQTIIAGLTETFSSAKIGNFCLSDIYSAIASSYNGCFELISPTGSIDLGDCKLPVLGTVNFVT